MLVSHPRPHLFQPTASAFIIVLKYQPRLLLLIIWAVPMISRKTHPQNDKILNDRIQKWVDTNKVVSLALLD